jgi:hypothetical protein
MTFFKNNNSVVNAIQVGREAMENGQIKNFCKTKIVVTPHAVEVDTVDGKYFAKPGDWIVKTMGDELVVLKNTLFRFMFNKA